MMKLMIRKTLSLVLLLGAAITVRAHAQHFITVGVRDAEVFRYFQKLQQVVRAGDRAGFAALVNYPLRVNRSAKDHFILANRAELIKRYAEVVTPSVQKGVLIQQPATLRSTQQGIAVSGGVVWLMGVCTRTRPPACHLGVSSVNQHVVVR
jgi:hypothetical protein